MDDLWERCNHTLYLRALRLARDSSEADDLVQEAFISALAHPEIFEYPPERQLAWLTRALRNRLIDRRRHERVEKAYVSLPRAIESHSDDLTIVEVRQAMSFLPREQSELLALRYFAGWNATQIAEYLGISSATVRTRLRAAVKKIKTLYCELD